jgi:hypothetical protein
MLRYDKVLFILEPTDAAKRLAGQKVIVCDYPDGRLEVMHEGITLPYRTFDKLRSVQRSEVVENKRLDDVLAFVAEMQAERELGRSQHGPRRTGQTNHMFAIPDGSQSNGYQKRKPRGRTDYMNDPAVIARRQQAVARMKAAEDEARLAIDKNDLSREDLPMERTYSQSINDPYNPEAGSISSKADRVKQGQ